jgi:hypothetical protein
MIVFADYDNIDRIAKARGLEYIIDRVVSSISNLPIAVQPRIDVQLYGGWFYGTQLSKAGQVVSAELSGTFPKRIMLPWTGQAAPVNIVVNSHIARSLAACQQLPLHHTFRRRPFSGRLYFKRPTAQQCHIAPCPLDIVERFISGQRCPENGCTVEQDQVLERCEQKLVDTMLVSDLIFWASRPNHPILAVFSSDDDMWPGIRTALSFAQPIIQIHTSRSPQHTAYVNRLSPQSYLQTTF